MKKFGFGKVWIYIQVQKQEKIGRNKLILLTLTMLKQQYEKQQRVWKVDQFL